MEPRTFNLFSYATAFSLIFGLPMQALAAYPGKIGTEVAKEVGKECGNTCSDSKAADQAAGKDSFESGATKKGTEVKAEADKETSDKGATD